MRIATCAKEAAGNSVKASNSASAIFFMVNRVLQDLDRFRNLVAFRLVEGINVKPRG
jgi:hypothetical protein